MTGDSAPLPEFERAEVVLVGSGSAALPDLPVRELQDVLRAHGALFSGATTPATPGRTV